MDLDLDTRPAGIALVVSDVDETLLTPDKRLTARTALAVRHLRQEGIHFTVASSRPPFGLASLVEPLALTVPIIACAGAITARPDDLEIIEQRPLPSWLVTEVIAALESVELDAWLFRADTWFVRSLRGPEVGREIRNLGTAPVILPNLGRVAGSDICKVVGVGDPEAVQRGMDLMHREYRGRASVSRSRPWYLDVLHPLVDKGRAVRRLADRLGIPLERVAVLGDSEGDLPMFQTAGLAIAMASAPVEIRRQADRTAPSNSADGVAAALEAWVLPLHPTWGHEPHPA
jgi:Cof subfamily protein (haloacid dehalogenase superfamily)